MADQSRRGFLKRLVAVSVMVAAAPLLALVRPAVAAVATPSLTLDELNEITLRMMPAITDEFFKADPLLPYLRSHTVTRVHGAPIQENLIYVPRGLAD